MATLILTAAGQALGSFLGGSIGAAALGGVLGKAAGALAGSAIDNMIFGASRTVEGPRLADLSVQSSNEGMSLPLVYGRVRLAGQVIWATNFEEEVTDEKQGGKGSRSGTTVRSYHYYANFAVALCEGPITGIGRIWADGKLLDTEGLNMRVYRGTQDQLPDPKIVASQTYTPAYRGTAYVMFERLPLEKFGNRMPQLNFEVIRSIEPLEQQVRAVTLIPGAGEFVYAPQQVTHTPSPGVSEALNNHVFTAKTDWTASLDELQALCPGLESVALVVSWFGDDLRAGHCRIRPKVEFNAKTTTGMDWSVSDLTRDQAQEVSRINGAPAFGGTPADDSVMAAIRDLKARGLKVMLYPFVLMDIPAGNNLPSPAGGTGQPAYPWRGRIVPVGNVETEAVSFFGTATATHFAVAADQVTYQGPQEWSFRRHVLHLAALAQAAGGVDAFLIGSELRGLTGARSASGGFPFVDGLRSLAQEARILLGTETKLSYAADWSEYGAQTLSGNTLRFPLDPLWADPAIDFIGIDNYLPMSDMREDGDPDGNTDPYDLDILRQGIAGGEYHEWYYATPQDRKNGTRTSITDGDYGKPFVFRPKDLKGWWQNQHFERTNGQEAATSTPWVPMSKPIWFTELGIPAIDKGANQPNLFVDPKSAESAAPHFSNHLRDDLIQRRALEAQLGYWDDRHPQIQKASIPVSPVYGGPMVDPARIHLWTWDARPYPAFPGYPDVWSDAANWQVGHWLSGRLGTLTLSGLVRQILMDFGISETDVQVGSLPGTLEGMAVPGPVSARQVIEPLLAAFGGIASDRGTSVLISRAAREVQKQLRLEDIAENDKATHGLLLRKRAQTGELPSEVRLSGADILADYRIRSVASRRLTGGSREMETLDLGAVASPDVLQGAADRRLARIWSEREKIEVSLSPACLDVEPGDVLAIAQVPGQQFTPPLRFRVESVEDTDRRRVEAVRVQTMRVPVSVRTGQAGQVWRSTAIGPPHALMLDLPKITGSEPDGAPHLAAFAKPWPGSISVLHSASTSGYAPVLTLDSPAAMGRLKHALDPGPLYVWDRGRVVDVELYGGALQSRSKEMVLAGGNALAVRCRGGGFEILQFVSAELTAPGTWRLSILLRGQKGTEDQMRTGAEAGADVVVLDKGSLMPVPLTPDRVGLEQFFKLVPDGLAVDDPAVVTLSHTASGRNLLPLPPVHLRAQRQAGGIYLSWIRQTRLNGDSWEQVEVPLGEDTEAYEVDIHDAQGTVLRTLTASSPGVLYLNADEQADHGAPVSILHFSVCQLSATAGRGLHQKRACHV